MALQERPTLLHLVSSRMWGGMERYALDICRDFAARGWRTEIFTRDIRSIDSLFADAGVKVHHAPFAGLLDLSTPLAIARFLRRREGPVVIHTHHYRDAFTALLARKLGRRPRSRVRVVCTHHRCRPAREGWLLRRVYRNLDAFIFVSELARRRFLSRWPHGAIPFSARAMHTVPPSIDVSAIPAYLPPPEKGPFVLLYLGRLSPEKGIEPLIRAMRLLKGKRVRLVIAGTGYADYVDSLRNLAVRAGVDSLIDWKGWTISPQRIIRLCHAGICVSPREEPFLLSSLEFMASGRTQIVPPDGAFPEYLHSAPASSAVRGETLPGLTDSLRLNRITEEEIAQAILTLAADRPLTERLGVRALENFHRLPGKEATMDRIEALYRAPAGQL